MIIAEQIICKCVSKARLSTQDDNRVYRKETDVCPFLEAVENIATRHKET